MSKIDDANRSKILKGEEKMENIIVRPNTLSEKLRNSILEMELIEQGVKPKRTWNEFALEFKKEIEGHEGTK